MITQEYLKQNFSYNPETGWFVNLSGMYGHTNYKGYLMFQLFGKHYRAHRLIWFYVKGEWPKEQIDHINNNKKDNRWINLREASNQSNQFNKFKPKNNTSGAKGVRLLNTGKYSARIKYNQKEIYLGIYDTLELASEAYFKKSKELAKEFANKG